MDGSDTPLQPHEDVFIPVPVNGGVIPVRQVVGASLAEAWELSLLDLWDFGMEVRTEYDRKDDAGAFIDPPSRDCRMTFVVTDPASDPRFHRCFPGGPEDLQEYRMEVLEGLKDHWMLEPDPLGTKWKYTYHHRLKKYQAYVRSESERNDGSGVHDVHRVLKDIDQIRKMIEHLARSPYTRRCQAITWQPWEDMDSSDPPCLQRIWCRILFDKNGEWWLNMDVEFRSRDGYKAAFMNADAFVLLMQYMADEIGKIAGRKVHLGHYCDTSNSYHIYGKDIAQFKSEFLAGVANRTFKDRTWPAEELVDMMRDSIPAIEEKVRSKEA